VLPHVVPTPTSLPYGIGKNPQHAIRIGDYAIIDGHGTGFCFKYVPVFNTGVHDAAVMDFHIS
jgi:hypothetical protein